MIDFTFADLSSYCFNDKNMNTFKKYVCACECIYNIFGVSRTQYVKVEEADEHDFDDLYQSSYGTRTHIPEVVHHITVKNTQCIDEKKDPDSILSLYNTNTKESTNRFTDNKLKITPSMISLPLAALSPIMESSDTDSQHSDSNSIDFIVPDKDLPERDAWDIL